ADRTQARGAGGMNCCHRVNLLSAEAWRDGARLAYGDSAAHETPYAVGPRRAGAFSRTQPKSGGALARWACAGWYGYRHGDLTKTARVSIGFAGMSSGGDANTCIPPQN
ncbi:MAG: hypothetical protein WBQ53_03070, partial [Methylocystis sp.]